MVSKEASSSTARRALTYASLEQAPSLVPIFQRIRNRLATLDRNVNRDEEILPDLSLLLLLKILDEQRHRDRSGEPLEFQVDGTPAKTARRLKDLLRSEVRRDPELFGAPAREIRFRIDDESIGYTVETLQGFRLLSNDADAVADAFQVIRGKSYKGEEGQYFTPRSVVRVAVAAVDPRPEDRVIDPACGSGSLLAAALENVIQHLKEQHGADAEGLARARREWSTTRLFAVDKDSVSARLSKAYLSMLGDGSAHVYKGDSIQSRSWSRTLASTIPDGTFDVVVTNPPFGTKLKVSEDVGRREQYSLSVEWKFRGGAWEPTERWVERDLGLLFLERSLRLLRDGGRLAIVLPDTYLFSDRYGWLTQWLSQYTITHSINVPIEAFEPHCRAKTSVIVLRKQAPPRGHRVVGALCETFGEDKHGRPRLRFVEGRRTEELDDEMAEAAELLRGRPPETPSKLHFEFSQDAAAARGVLVASYWWKAPYIAALETFAGENDCELRSVDQLLAEGELQVLDGHGSPSSHYHGRGTVPYVKVVDIKNWRVNENPKYGVPEDVAERYRRGKALQPYDLVTPTRASKNIGLFGVLMPWQTRVVLTREIAVWRIRENAARLDPWLLLALMSLRCVHDQFRFLVLMQMNREDLGERYRELLLPIPRTKAQRETWSRPIREYFEATARARSSYTDLAAQLDPELFVDRP